MTATFRVTCTCCGWLRTSVVSAEPDVLEDVPEELRDLLEPWHNRKVCGGRLDVETKYHRLRGAS